LSLTSAVHFIKLDKKGKEPEVFIYSADNGLTLFYECLNLYRRFFKNGKEQVNIEDI